MTTTVKNIKVGNTSYPVQDTKATPFLSSTDEATLLSDGTYRGEEVSNNTIFSTTDGVLKKFTKTIVDKHWITGTAQTRLGRTNLSIHDQVSAQNGNYVVTSLYYTDARRSTDRGATWVSAGNSSYNASGTSCTVYVQKTGKFYCGTSLGLLATDGTASFSRVGSSTSTVTTYATDGNILCCFGGCYTFDNEGTPTWTAANYSVVAARYDSVSGVFYGQRQSTNGYYESTDGYTWTLKGSPGQYFNWVAKRGNVVVGFRRNGSSNTKRYVSTDGGVTWTSEAFADQEWFGGVYQGLFYMGRTGASADFRISTDGLTWTQMNRPDTAAAQALVRVDDKIYMGNYAYYFTTGIDYNYALTPLSYTASEVDSALSDKQDTLTASTGIDITDGTISVTDPTLTNLSTHAEGLVIGSVGTTQGALTAYGCTAIGKGINAVGPSQVLIGNRVESKIGYSSALATTVIGANAKSSAHGNIALGAGCNNTEAGTFKVSLSTAGAMESFTTYTVLDSNGRMPAERLSEIIILGENDPTENTEGTLGLIYKNTLTGELFRCSAIEENTSTKLYTWVKLVDASNTYSKAEIDAMIGNIETRLAQV